MGEPCIKNYAIVMFSEMACTIIYHSIYDTFFLSIFILELTLCIYMLMLTRIKQDPRHKCIALYLDLVQRTQTHPNKLITVKRQEKAMQANVGRGHIYDNLSMKQCSSSHPRSHVHVAYANVARREGNAFLRMPAR